MSYSMTKRRFQREAQQWGNALAENLLAFQYHGMERLVEFVEDQGEGFLGFQLEKDKNHSAENVVGYRSFTYAKIEGDVEIIGKMH